MNQPGALWALGILQLDEPLRRDERYLAYLRTRDFEMRDLGLAVQDQGIACPEHHDRTRDYGQEANPTGDLLCV